MLGDKNHPRYTYGDYIQWTGDDRWELVDGEAFDMTPAPSRLHQLVVGGILTQIRSQLAGHRCQVYDAPFDVRLPKGNEADEAITTVVQPDVSVICDPSKLDDAGCRGAPDWIIEILSPRTSARDRQLKRELYERSGVREYWHLDPVARRLTRFAAATGGGAFGDPIEGTAEGASRPTVLPEIEIDWSFVFAE